MKCRDCFHYKEANPNKGRCFGVEIDGNRDIKDSDKCKGKYFKPRVRKEAKV